MPAKSYARWTLADDSALTDQYKRGVSVSEIAAYLERSEHACRNRIMVLQLHRPPARRKKHKRPFPLYEWEKQAIKEMAPRLTCNEIRLALLQHRSCAQIREYAASIGITILEQV